MVQIIRVSKLYITVLKTSNQMYPNALPWEKKIKWDTKV